VAQTITLNAIDPDSDSVTYEIDTEPEHGTLTGSGTAWTYTPATNYNGTDRFVFKATDGTDYGTRATVLLEITGVNDAPVFSTSPITAAGQAGDAFSGSLAGSATDVDGDTLSYSILSGPSWLSVAADGTLSGTPGLSDQGLGSWQIQVEDGNGETATNTLEINVFATHVATFPMEEDFESYTHGAPLTGSNGWYGSGSVAAADYAGEYTGAYPLAASDHTRICEAGDEATLLIESGADLPGVWFDSVVQFETAGDLVWAAIPENATAWFGVDENLHLNVYHGVDGGAADSNVWTALSQTSIAAHQWVRLTVETSYANGAQTHSFFRVYVDGSNALTSPAAYLDRDDLSPAAGGTWFLCANQSAIGKRISQLQLKRVQCDDLVLTTNSVPMGDALDRDGDGMSDWREAIAGTDPTNGASVLQINGMSLTGNQLTFDWQAVSGKNYTVWFATNLLDSAWQEMTNGIPGVEPSATATLQTDTAAGYIRIEVE
jgi:VCBS repeat-containing protein